LSEFAYIVANKTGGQGKTTVAQLLYEALLDAGVGPRLAAIDRAGGSRRRSKLGTLYPQTFDWGVAADRAELAAGQGEAALRHWDVLSRVLKQRHVVIDVGANAIDPMLRWMQLSLTADARHPMNFLVVSTAQEHAAADAMAVLDEIEASRRAIAVGRIGVVLNGAFGSFDQPGDKVAGLMALAKARGYPIIQLPFGYLNGVDRGIAISRLRGLTWQEYQAEMAIPVAGTAERLLLKTQRFIRQALEALREAGFAPPAV